MVIYRGRLLSVFRRSGTHHGYHRDVLRRTAAENRGAVTGARDVLRQEREAAARASHEHRLAFVHARTQARREGRRLLTFLDRLPHPR